MLLLLSLHTNISEKLPHTFFLILKSIAISLIQVFCVKSVWLDFLFSSLHTELWLLERTCLSYREPLFIPDCQV